MTRSEEFGLGATFKQKEADGTEHERNAIEVVGGGQRDASAVSRLPQDRGGDVPVATTRRAGPLPYPRTHQEYVEDLKERDWSRGQ